MAFKGNTAELNVDLGARRYFGRWSSRPSIAMDWSLSQLGGGQETPVGGGNDALRYDKVEHSQLFFRFGTDLRYGCGPLTLESGLYYSYDMLGQILQADVSSAAPWGNNGNNTLLGSQLGRSVVSYNLGGSLALNRTFTVFGGYRGELTPESAGRSFAHIGHAGATLRW
jgi:hypothetical protein